MLRLRYNDEAVQRTLAVQQRRLSSWRIPFRTFHQYMRKEIASVFDRNRTGGTHRGIRWAYFAPYYTRQTPPGVVPAWGGVRKVFGRGRVKGRKRPSGRRVRRGDAIVQDTGHLKRASGHLRYMSRSKMEMRPTVRYAGYQQSMRPFMFFQTPRDSNRLLQLMHHYLMKGTAIR